MKNRIFRRRLKRLLEAVESASIRPQFKYSQSEPSNRHKMVRKENYWDEGCPILGWVNGGIQGVHASDAYFSEPRVEDAIRVLAKNEAPNPLVGFWISNSWKMNREFTQKANMDEPNYYIIYLKADENDILPYWEPLCNLKTSRSLHPIWDRIKKRVPPEVISILKSDGRTVGYTSKVTGHHFLSACRVYCNKVGEKLGSLLRYTLGIKAIDAPPAYSKVADENNTNYLILNKIDMEVVGFMNYYSTKGFVKGGFKDGRFFHDISCKDDLKKIESKELKDFMHGPWSWARRGTEEQYRRHPKTYLSPEAKAKYYHPTYFDDDDEVPDIANVPGAWMDDLKESRKIRLPRTALLSPYYYL